MKKYPNIYLIHYSKLKERKIRIMKDLSVWPAKIEIIEKFDREEITKKIRQKYHSTDQKEYEKKLIDLNRQNLGIKTLLDADISLILKHLYAYKKIIESNEEYALILEDDAIPEKDFLKKFQDYLNNTPFDWDIIFIGEGCGENFIKEKLKTAIEINKHCYEIKNTNCTEAYLIKKTMAQKLIEKMQKFMLPIDWEIEHQIQKINAKIIWWTPAIFIQGSKNGTYKSSIE